MDGSQPPRIGAVCGWEAASCIGFLRVENGKQPAAAVLHGFSLGGGQLLPNGDLSTSEAARCRELP